MKRDPSLSDNPWLHARREWDERYGELLSRAYNWRIAALLAMLCAAILAIGVVVMATQSRLVPYVVAVDQIGRASYEGLAAPAGADARVIQATLAQWIQSWRTVISDGPAQRQLVDRVFAHLGNQGPAAKQVTDWYRTTDPFKRATETTVVVEVVSVHRVSEGSWEVEWVEKPYDKQGTQSTPQRFRGTVSVVLNPPANEAAARRNPLGIYLREINFGEIFGPEKI